MGWKVEEAIGVKPRIIWATGPIDLFTDPSRERESQGDHGKKSGDVIKLFLQLGEIEGHEGKQG
jgi:hypothetical protein